MENLNRQFFDEYTKLDNLCRQMFNSEKGVTSYIEAMESTPAAKSRNVPEWGSDLKMLKQYTWQQVILNSIGNALKKLKMKIYLFHLILVKTLECMIPKN